MGTVKAFLTLVYTYYSINVLDEKKKKEKNSIHLYTLLSQHKSGRWVFISSPEPLGSQGELIGWP